MLNTSYKFNFKKSTNDSLNSRKMRGAGFSGKMAKKGGFESRKKGGVAGNIWKYTTRASAFGGATRKNGFKNLSNKDLKTMSGLIYDEIKKNTGAGLTKYQKQKIIRKARLLVTKSNNSLSREDLKDFKKIVNKIDNQSDNIGQFKKNNNLTNQPISSQKVHGSKIINNTAHTMYTTPLQTPIALKRNNIKKIEDNEEEEKENKNRKIKNIKTNMNLKNGPTIINKINQQEKNNNKFDDLDLPLTA